MGSVQTGQRQDVIVHGVLIIKSAILGARTAGELRHSMAIHIGVQRDLMLDVHAMHGLCGMIGLATQIVKHRVAWLDNLPS